MTSATGGAGPVDPPEPGDPDAPGSDAQPGGPEGDDRPDLLGRLDPDRGRTESEPGRTESEPGRTETEPGHTERAPARTEPARRPGGLHPSMVTPGGAPPVDTRRYRWMIGIIGLSLLAIFSVYQFATHGVGRTGVPPGQRLHYFAAPLAATTLTGSANLSPPCTLARHDPRALNICLLAQRGPLVLSFFVTGSGQCTSQVDALQQLSARFARSGIQFVAVAVSADRASTRRAIRTHHWTIPIAYDDGGGVGGLYGVAVCPMAELAARGGIVRDLLVGDRWASSQALAPRVQALASANPTGG